MLQITYQECQWGTNEITGGVQLNLRDPDSGIVSIIPWTGETIAQLVNELIEKMPAEYRALVKIGNGIVPATPEDMQRIVKDAPQG